MNELIKIERQEVAGQSIQTVNARDLHEFLGAKKDFSDWIKKQIERVMVTAKGLSRIAEIFSVHA